jgi:hypothetical protein
MKRGYLVMAQGADYVLMAESLARSIKRSQSEVSSISIITDQKKVDKTLFDKVIKLKNDISGNAEWKIHNRCKFYDLTPYDETVILDADMLFIDDVSHWWKLMSKYEFLYTKDVTTVRGDKSTSNPYREAFDANNLPYVYSAFTYFKKCNKAKTIFDLVTSMMSNWEEWAGRYAPEKKQEFPSLDLAIAMAVDILDIAGECESPVDFPTFTHMKSGCQGWKHYSEDWKVHLGIYVTDGEIRLGNHVQSGILHYVDKDFIKETGL